MEFNKYILVYSTKRGEVKDTSWTQLLKRDSSRRQSRAANYFNEGRLIVDALVDYFFI
jgi:hypothetical protein